MAMQQRGSGEAKRSRSAGVRPVFEDFKPISEWEQDDESHLLVIYLPGFMNEQIKVSTEGRNIIRVRGERLVAGNKWSRFLEDFQIPENCEMSSIQTKHEGGNITITLPKKNVGTTSSKKPRNSLPTGPNELTEEKNMRQQKMLDDQRDKNSITPVRNANNLVLQDIELKEDQSASNMRQAIVPANTVDKGRKNLEQRKELPQVENIEKQKFDKDYSAFKIGNYKKKVKTLTALNEERQLLVNMGVAVLVIVALSAYVTS